MADRLWFWLLILILSCLAVGAGMHLTGITGC